MNGLITFEQLKEAVTEEYREFTLALLEDDDSSPEEHEDLMAITVAMMFAENLDELYNILIDCGFDDPYDFVLSSILIKGTK